MSVSVDWVPIPHVDTVPVGTGYVGRTQEETVRIVTMLIRRLMASRRGTAAPAGGHRRGAGTREGAMIARQVRRAIRR